jgi:hypothetical protein
MSQNCHIGLQLECFGAEVPGMAYRSFKRYFATVPWGAVDP